MSDQSSFLDFPLDEEEEDELLLLEEEEWE